MKYSLTKHYKYKLEEEFVQDTGITGYEFDTKYMAMFENGRFLVKKSYSWDGSSIPHKKLLQIVSIGIYDPDKYCKKASLIHDGLCQAMREGLLPKKLKQAADKLYRIMCIEGGMSVSRATDRYFFLRKFGDKGIEPEKKPRNKIYDTEKEK